MKYILVLIVATACLQCTNHKKTNKADSSASDSDKPGIELINDIYVVRTINGEDWMMGNDAIEPARLEIKLADKTFGGFDGCNNFSGKLEELTATDIAFGMIGATRKMCPDMERPMAVHTALEQTKHWQRNELMLTFSDSNGHELMVLQKVD